MQIRFEVNGLDLLNQRLQHIAKAAEAFSEFSDEILDEFENYEAAWFDSQGRGTWAPLSPSYAEWKAQYAPGEPLLVLTGALRDSEWRSQVGRNEMVIKLVAPDYWRFHQFGTVKMPARPPYVIDAGLARTLGNALAQAIIRKMR